MASLNTSQNGPSITKSYQSIVNSLPPSGTTTKSPTYGQWAVFAVSAPLVSAFQNEGGKESVLKVQSTGEGELVDLIEEFSDGRIQFAFIKVKDPNTTLPKNVLISWCGEGVPERTKGYFNSHRSVVAKLLHGYHVEITSRSDRDLTPANIVQKVADASGAKYGGGESISTAGRPSPTVLSKPVFTPTRIGGGNAFNALGGRSTAPEPYRTTDKDGWGTDAPPVTRTQLEKVQSAYQPTKVNMAELQSKREPSRFTPSTPENEASDIIKGTYQPVGRVDIAALRRQAMDRVDDRPTIVKGAYEPVGKVDIAAIRARARPSDGQPQRTSPVMSEADEDERSKTLSEHSSAFQSSGRLAQLPKPKVANKNGGVSNSAGTKTPTLRGFDPINNTKSAPIGAASRTFADEGGKTPAQIWAEKKARQGGGVISPSATGGTPASPIRSQQSGGGGGGGGGWQSGYSGKSWAPVQTTRTGTSAVSNLSDQRTGGSPQQEEQTSSGGIGSIRDRFTASDEPPPVDMSSRPGASRGMAIPGVGTHARTEQHVDLPTPPAQPRSPSPDEADYRPSSPIRVAMPVSRTKAAEHLEAPEEPSQAMPPESLAKVAIASRHTTENDSGDGDDPARGAAQVVAGSTFGAGVVSSAPSNGGRTAVVQYDYEKAEDNELELVEGQVVSNIEMIDEDWWMGTNKKGESGLFPSNYVEIVEDDPATAPLAAPRPVPESTSPSRPTQSASGAGKSAVAQYDYEAAEDNELSFPDGAKILNVEFPDEDWWFGEYGGKSGLFPANYVQLDE